MLVRFVPGRSSVNRCTSGIFVMIDEKPFVAAVVDAVDDSAVRYVSIDMSELAVGGVVVVLLVVADGGVFVIWVPLDPLPVESVTGDSIDELLFSMTEGSVGRGGVEGIAVPFGFCAGRIVRIDESDGGCVSVAVGV